ncbi:MAG: heme exporter protein CcmD [Bosea sp. (in: a-proteobacteria)]
MSFLPNLGPHAAFILLSYGAALLIIGGLVLSVIADHRAQKRKLAELEARGITRRSET